MMTREQMIEVLENRYGWDDEWVRWFRDEVWTAETDEEAIDMMNEAESMIGYQKGIWTKMRIIAEHYEES